ncbi:MAG: hypothetical protein II490_04535 [Oscillospiraceae bacterium]|nr:hypothetical protein [Oscillospiraceae bacterium]
MKVVLIILLVLFLIALIPLGASFEYSEDGLLLAAHIGFIKIGILPKKEKGEKKKKGGTAEFILKVLEAVFNTLNRFRKKLTVNYLKFYYTSASPDPYDAAMNYGKSSALAGVVLPLAEKAFRIKKSDIRTFVSFDGEGDRIYISAKLTLMIWEIIYVVCGLIPAVKAYLRWNAGGKEEKNG